MITIFGDFRQFSAKKFAFFSKTNILVNVLPNLALFSVKNANLSPFFAPQNISKIITSGHPSSECLGAENNFI
jgi:hypothetical protein